MEWQGRRQQYALEDFLVKQHMVFRRVFYIVLIGITFVFSSQMNQEFIYFQF
jgi:alginate O-acetyltransferase complex protein AlgI